MKMVLKRKSKESVKNGSSIIGMRSFPVEPATFPLEIWLSKVIYSMSAYVYV
jgi:hypothetical protein